MSNPAQYIAFRPMLCLKLFNIEHCYGYVQVPSTATSTLAML